jgi:predicted nuclease with TOPRIM domain
MDNSTMLRKTDELSSLKEYIWELEEKAREQESTKELLMSETLKFTSKVEKLVAGFQRLSHSGLGHHLMNPQIEQVGFRLHEGI